MGVPPGPDSGEGRHLGLDEGPEPARGEAESRFPVIAGGPGGPLLERHPQLARTPIRPGHSPAPNAGLGTLGQKTPPRLGGFRPDHRDDDTVIVPSPFLVTRWRAKSTQPRSGVRTHQVSLPSGRTTRP